MASVLIVALLTSGLYAGLWLFACVLVGQPRDRPSLRWASLGAMYAGLGVLALYLPTWSVLRIDGWNWQGKILLWLLAVSGLLWLGVRGVFGEWRPSEWYSRSSLLLFAAVIALGRLSTLVFQGDSSEVHRLLFQFSMPGLSEEVFFRGTLLAVTLKALGATTAERGVFASYVVVGLLFCFAHGVYPIGGRITVDLFGMVSPLVIGALLSGLRYTSHSVVPCIVAHNIFNVA